MLAPFPIYVLNLSLKPCDSLFMRFLVQFAVTNHYWALSRVSSLEAAQNPVATTPSLPSTHNQFSVSHVDTRIACEGL